MTDNPVGITGFDFIEFSTPEPEKMHQLFQILGFSRLRQHKDRNVSYYNQNDIHFFLNNEPGSFAVKFSEDHGPCACSTGWRVEDAVKAQKTAIERGAKKADDVDFRDEDGKEIPAIYGVGDSLIYFLEKPMGAGQLDKLGFEPLAQPDQVESKGFYLIDHLTNNVNKGELIPLSNFYKDVFGFTEVRFFDIKGEETGLLSYALRSPCESFCIPINEGTEDKSQINEYLREYKGQGIQHIALLTPDIIKVMESIKPGELKTLDIDEDYYNEVFKRIPGVKEDHLKIKDFNLLVDGDDKGYLIQIFTENVVGPIFFEFIQRNNNLGFGEGNFGALFRAIERDQRRRGVL